MARIHFLEVTSHELFLPGMVIKIFPGLIDKSDADFLILFRWALGFF